MNNRPKEGEHNQMEFSINE